MLVVEDFFNHVKSANKKYKHYNGVDAADYKDYLRSFDNAMLFEIDSKLIYDGLSNIVSELNHLSSKDRLPTMMHYIDSFPIEQLTLPAPTTYITVKNLGHHAVYGIDNGYTSFLITKDLIAVYVYNSDSINQKIDIIYYQYGIWYTNDILTTHKLVCNIILLLEVINNYNPTINNHLNIKNYRPRCNLLNKKKLTRTPDKFYTINLDNGMRVAKTTSQDTKRASYEKSYAYQVMGHFKYRIMVGDLPMEEKVQKYLIRNERRKIIMKAEDIDEKYKKILDDRQVQYKEGQWISVLESHVESYIANSKKGDSTFIPAVRIIS